MQPNKLSGSSPIHPESARGSPLAPHLYGRPSGWERAAELRLLSPFQRWRLADVGVLQALNATARDLELLRIRHDWQDLMGSKLAHFTRID
jgi:hypothetical protein